MYVCLQYSTGETAVETGWPVRSILSEVMNAIPPSTVHGWSQDASDKSKIGMVATLKIEKIATSPQLFGRF